MCFDFEFVYDLIRVFLHVIQSTVLGVHILHWKNEIFRLKKKNVKMK